VDTPVDQLEQGMDIDGGDGRQPVRQLLGEAGLQQPATTPGDHVDRRTIGTASAARRQVIDRHTWFVLRRHAGLTELAAIR